MTRWPTLSSAGSAVTPSSGTRPEYATAGVPEALSWSRLRRSAAFDAGAARVAEAPREAVVTIGGRRLGPYERTRGHHESPRSGGACRRHDRRWGPARWRRPCTEGARTNGAGPVRGSPRPRFLGLDPRRCGEPEPLRRRPRADRGSRQRDVVGPRRRRRHRDDRPVRHEGGRLPRLRRPEAARQRADGRTLRRLPEISRERVPEGSRSRTHPEDRHRHELRRGDGAGRQAPSAGRRPAGADPVHRRKARRPGRTRQPGAGRSRPTLREPLAVRTAASRYGPQSD